MPETFAPTLAAARARATSGLDSAADLLAVNEVPEW